MTPHTRLLSSLVAPLRRCTLTQLIELLAMADGHKPAVRLTVNDDELDALTARAAECGLHVAVARKRLREVADSDTGDVYTVSVDWSDPTGDAFAVFLAMEERRARLPADLESEDRSSVAIGQALGLPDCCGRAYVRIQQGAHWLEQWASDAGQGVLDFAANHLASFGSGLSPAGEYLPCSPRCAETAARARLGAGLARRAGLIDAIGRWECWARCDALVVRRTAFVLAPPTGDKVFVIGEARPALQKWIEAGKPNALAHARRLSFASQADVSHATAGGLR